MEELEQRVKHMEDELQQLRQSVESPDQSMRQFPGLSPSPIRDRDIEHRTEGPILPGAHSPVGEVSQAEQGLCNPPSYFLRVHDGKMRFFGLSPFLSHSPN